MSSSFQRQRNQPDKPRVVMGYEELRDDGTHQRIPLPFDIGVFADLAGHQKRSQGLAKRELIAVESKNGLNAVFSQIRPMVNVEVTVDGKSQKVPIEINSMADFGPDNILKALEKNLEGVGELMKLRKSLLKFREMANLDPAYEETFRELSKGGPEALEEYLKKLG